MAQMEIDEKVFQLPIDIDASGEVTKTLATADTYVDKNIKVTVTTPDGELEVKEEGEITAKVSTTDTTYTSDTETKYPITIAADADITEIKVGVKTPGFVDNTDEVVLEASSADQVTKTIYVKEGTIGGEGDVTATSTNMKLGAKTSTEPESGFYFKASGAGKVEVKTAGWVDPDDTTAIETDSEAYYPVEKASLANTGTGDYEELTTPVLTSGGYLYINEGYLANTKVSLATLIPDEAVIPDVVDGESEWMYKTVSAYDKDGNLVAGTMDDAEIGDIVAENVEAAIDTVTFTANDEETAFIVTGTGDITGDSSVSIAKRGLATTEMSKTGEIEGTAALEATVAKIGLGVVIEEGKEDVTVTPEISKEDTTNAKTGDITTTKPEAGKYVAVSTAAIEKEVEISPNVLTAGYGTADVYSATADTVTAGAAASGVYYVPITAGEHTVDLDGETAITNAAADVSTATEASDGFDGNLAVGFVEVEPTSGVYITISATADTTNGSVSGNVVCDITEGYVETAQEKTNVSGEVEVDVTDAKPKYIKVYDGTIL